VAFQTCAPVLPGSLLLYKEPFRTSILISRRHHLQDQTALDLCDHPWMDPVLAHRSLFHDSPKTSDYSSPCRTPADVAFFFVLYWECALVDARFLLSISRLHEVQDFLHSGVYGKGSDI